MPELISIDEHTSPTLRLYYDTLFPLGAAETGALIEALGKGFTRYARSQGWRNLRLAVVDVGIGSYWIDLAVLSAGAIFTYRKEIYDFTGFLGKLFDIGKGLRRDKASPADQKLVNVINAPVATGRATQLNLTVLGGAPIIIIDRQMLDGMWANSHGQADDGPTFDLSEARLEVRSLKDRTRPRPRDLDGLSGTIFDVKGQLYVRLEGEEGVLNPAVLASGIKVEDGATYRFAGSWEGRHYVITQAHPIAPIPLRS